MQLKIYWSKFVSHLGIHGIFNILIITLHAGNSWHTIKVWTTPYNPKAMFI